MEKTSLEELSKLLTPSAVFNRRAAHVAADTVPESVWGMPYWARSVSQQGTVPNANLSVSDVCFIYGMSKFDPDYRALLESDLVAPEWVKLITVFCESGLNVVQFAALFDLSRTTMQARISSYNLVIKGDAETFHKQIATMYEAYSPGKPEIQAEFQLDPNLLVPTVISAVTAARDALALFVKLALQSQGVGKYIQQLLVADNDDVLLELENLVRGINNPESESYRAIFGGGKYAEK